MNLDAALALNAAHEKETGPLAREELATMIAGAFFHTAEADGKDGFLISFDQDASYESPNFQWFKARHARFVYVDRIIIAAHARRRGLAQQFYRDLIATMRNAGHDRLVCEVNLDPPNPGSIAFHQAMGFVETGQAQLTNGKLVSYQELGLTV